MGNICIICKNKFAEKREFCTNCYSRGLRDGTIQRLKKPELPRLLDDCQKQVLLGLLLGDGCLFKAKNATHPFLSITRAKKDIAYLQWQYDVFKAFCMSGVSEREIHDKRTNKTYQQVKVATRRALVFEQYYCDWYGNGKKSVPRTLNLSPLTNAIWFCDDGCITRKTKTRLLLKLSTHGFSFDDVEYLKDILDRRFGEKFLIYKDSCGPFIYASDNGARAFVREIDSYIPDSMTRKVKWRDSEVELFSLKRAKNYINVNGVRQYDVSNQ